MSETDKLGNCEKNWRSTTGQKIFNRLAENGEFHAWRNFDPSDRRKDRNIARHGFNFSVRDGGDSAIVVIGNRSAVQPCMEWRVDFGHRHEQPDGQ